MESKEKKLEDEYTLRDVARIWLSDECITPNNLPRITQPSYGKYMIRTDGKSDFCNQKSFLHPSILNKLANRGRAHWVPTPGVNDYFVHEMCKKYHLENFNYHPKNMPFKRLIPRPYSCEYDYIENERQKGMADIESRHLPGILKYRGRSRKMAAKVADCKIPSPFWWEGGEGMAAKYDRCEKVFPKPEERVVVPAKRWRPVPDLLADKWRTCCQRKLEFSEVGQPFIHEACQFYNVHYPAPKLTIFKEKFSK